MNETTPGPQTPEPIYTRGGATKTAAQAAHSAFNAMLSAEERIDPSIKPWAWPAAGDAGRLPDDAEDFDQLLEELGAFVFKNRAAPPEALYRQLCKLGLLVDPTAWLEAPTPTRVAITVFARTIPLLYEIADEAEETAKLAAAVAELEEPLPDKGLGKRSMKKGGGRLEKQKMTHKKPRKPRKSKATKTSASKA